jgi:hypothetical protein
MSALAVVPGDNGVVFACDGAASNDGIVVSCRAPKIIAMPEICAVLGFVGIGALGFLLRREMELTGADGRVVSAGGFDAIVENLSGLMRAAHRQAAPGMRDDRATAVLAGWSEARGRFETVKVHSFAKEATNVATGEKISFAPWEVHSFDMSWMNSNPGPEISQSFGIDAAAAPGTPLLDFAARMVCAARASCGDREMAAEQGVYAVGGMLQLTVLLREKITSWIAHRWPDPIGEPIDPSRGEPMPAFPLAMP